MTHDSQPVFQKGEFVRFKHLPARMSPTPIKITGVSIRGWLYLENRKGTFAPKLFERVPRNVLIAGDQEEVKP
jgi:hypothetical protein